MKFTPKSEKDLANGDLLPAGTYDFEVKSAEEATSSTGNGMVKLSIWIFPESGTKRTVFDYLVGTESAQFKVRGFAAAVGLLEEYDGGEMDALDMEGKTGKCKIVIQKDKSGAYPDKNSVASYVAAPVTTGSVEKKTARAAKVHGGGDLNDDIPFSACWQ